MFKHHVHTGVDIDAIKYTTKQTTKMKAKFSYCDEVNFNEPVLKTRNTRIAAYLRVFPTIFPLGVPWTPSTLG